MTNLIILKDELGLALTDNELSLELKAALVVGSGGAADFTDLGDVPASYSGAAGKFVAVNGGATGLEFVPAPGGGGGVTGPSSAVDSGVALFDGTAGNLLKDGGALGTAAFTASSAYATAAQGAAADTALQPAAGLAALDSAAASKLSGIEIGAQANVQSDWNAVSGDALIKNKPSLGSLAAKSSVDIADINAIGTPGSSNYLRGDGRWETAGGGVWGGITGTLSDQTDLQNALDAKASASGLSAHTSDTGNPHSVTKAQVGLGNVDNTADASKEVLSATKLKTARTIGGVSFDGSADINLPGVDTAGNQNTTGTAANVTGTVAVANGGTGATDAAAARSNLGAGDVVGPASSIANNLAIFNGLTGKALKDKSDTVQLDTDSGKSSSATFGSDILTNGDFVSDTVWTKGSGWSIGSGVSVFDTTVATPGTLSQTITVAANKLYLITWTATNSSSRNAGMSVSIGGVGLGGAMLPDTTVNTYSVALAVTIGGSATFSITPIVYNKSGTVTIDNVSVREITQTVPDLILSSPSGDIAVTAKNKSLFIGGGGLSNTTGEGNFASGDKALFNNTSGSNNVALGDGALFNNTIGSNNYASGSQSLFNNISGSNNFASGYRSLYNNTTGNNNFASGINTLLNNTVGYDNVAIGADVLNKNTIGFGNVGIGFNALYENTNGASNCAFGTRALTNNTIGYSNFAMGYESLRNNSTGIHNSCVGTASTANLSSGSYNTNIGSNAGTYYGSGSSSLTTSSNSTLIGRDTRTSANSAVNQTVIGYTAIGVGDNTVSLGNSAVTLTSTYGQLSSSGTYSATSASAANVFIDTDGKMYRSTSSDQYKKDIEPIDTAIADKLILQANPVWFKSTAARDAGKSFYGLIAEEVAALDPRMVQWGYPTKRVVTLEAREAIEAVYDENGVMQAHAEEAVEAMYADVPDYEATPIPEGVNYTAMIAPLIDLVKRQHASIEALTTRVISLESKSLKG